VLSIACLAGCREIGWPDTVLYAVCETCLCNYYHSITKKQGVYTPCFWSLYYWSILPEIYGHFFSMIYGRYGLVVTVFH